MNLLKSYHKITFFSIKNLNLNKQVFYFILIDFISINI